MKIYKANQIDKSLPDKVRNMMVEDIEMFDYYYGKNRNIYYEGGYIYLLESEEDLDDVLSVWSLDNPSVIPEIVEEVGNEEEYIRILLIASNGDYNIIYYVKSSLVPERIMDYMEEG